MGIHSESTNSRYPPVDAEMRRRLWWSLMLFDTRICEMADYKLASLLPTWDCGVPQNINDSDLSVGMKEVPRAQRAPTDAIFAVVRAEVSDAVRHMTFHLDFICPALKPIAKDVMQGHGGNNNELDILENMIEDKYLQHCNVENPLHFITIWMTRGFLARCRLVQHFSRLISSPGNPTGEALDSALSHSFAMLESDTRIMASPLTKGYLWFLQTHFPFIAYINIVQDLKRRPVSQKAEYAWEVMSDNFEARFYNGHNDYGALFKMFSSFVLQAWKAREAAFKDSQEPLAPPRIVLHITQTLFQMANDSEISSNKETQHDMDVEIGDMAKSMATGFDTFQPLDGTTWQGPIYGDSAPGIYLDNTSPAPFDIGTNQLHWAAMHWGLATSPVASLSSQPPNKEAANNMWTYM
jgi:hypothetical protein